MDRRAIERGLRTLAGKDEALAVALDQVGFPTPRNRPAGFETLLNTIISQQLSTESSAAIRRRVLDLMNAPTPANLLRLSDDALRSAGLSYRKVEYAKGLAEAITDGRLQVDDLAEMADEEAIATITSLRGFGRWSAEIYLMFSLGRRDVFPADDLALRVALGRLKGLTAKPTAGQARKLIEHWSPWRSVGSLFLWHYYRGAPD